ncbi:MAG: prepilin peptidase [Bacillota bacterium]
MHYFWITFFGLMGAIWGSFCNVLISRIPASENISGRSHCPHCHHTLSASDLVPVLSYFLLGGRCRYCAAPISARYPLVEMSCSLLFILSYRTAGLNPAQLILLLLYVTVAVVIAVVDFEHTIIPNRMVLVGILGVAGGLILGLGPEPVSALIGALIGGGTFMILYLVTRGGGIGMGDVKLVLLMGLALGPLKLLPAVLAGAIAALIFAGAIMLRFKRELASLENVSIDMEQEEEPEISGRVWGMMIINGRPAVPFGPFLALGFLTSLFWGEQILDLWLG